MENKPTIKVEKIKASYGPWFNHVITFGFEHSQEQTIIQLSDEQYELLRNHFNAPSPSLTPEANTVLEERVKQALIPLQQELERLKQVNEDLLIKISGKLPLA